MNQGGHLDQFLARDPTFPGELWAWFCFGTTVTILRFGVRLRMAGIVGLAGDDYFMVLTFAFHVAFVAIAFFIYQYGTNVDLGQSQIDQLSDQEVVQLVEGSKYLQVSWYLYTCFLWCIKACALSFYRRLTFSLWQHTWVFKALCWITFLSFVAVILVISLSCLPYENNFLVRFLPPPQCLLQTQNLVAAVVLNMLTDAAILILPIPVLRDLRLPWFKKLAIGLLVCSGFFVISAAAIRLAVTLDAAPSAVTIVRWGIRECEIGLFALCAPVLRPLFSRRLWGGVGASRGSRANTGRSCCFSLRWLGGGGASGTRIGTGTWDVEAVRHSSAGDSPGETPRRHQRWRRQRQRHQQQQQQEWEFQQYTGRQGRLETGEGSSSRPDREGDMEKSQERGGGGGGGDVAGFAVSDVDLVGQSGPSLPRPFDDVADDPMATGATTACECAVAGSAEDGMERGLPATRAFYGLDDDNRREKRQRRC